MNNNSSTFQTLLLVGFGVLLALAVILFIAVKPKKTQQEASATGSVTVWGTLSKDAVMSALALTTKAYPDLKVAYSEFPLATFDETLVDALASGGGPDVIILPSTEVLRQRNRIEVLGATTYPPAQFIAQYADATKSFMLPWGVAGIPLVMDPMVLYYNRDILNAAFIVEAPKTWQDLDKQIPSLTIRTPETDAITQSAIAMGTTANIDNVADILSLLMLQSGGVISKFDGEKFMSTLRDASPANPRVQPAQVALDFYTSFADPTSGRYSWNPGLRKAQDAFLAGETAYYLGYASEYNSLRKKNPNLNFDITLMPQPEGSKNKVTGARVYGASLTKNSQKKQIAFTVMNLLSSPGVSRAIAEKMTIAPVLRSELGTIQTDTRMTTIYRSGIISATWSTPDMNAVKKIFAEMINGAQSGLLTSSQAITRADAALNAELYKMRPPVTPETAAQ